MKKIFIYLLLLFSTVSFGQVNLVPNPSFEDTVACPTTANQVDRAVGWYPSRNSPDYFNGCDWINGLMGVPNNAVGFNMHTLEMLIVVLLPICTMIQTQGKILHVHY
jgi:hypothetical protein